MNGLDAEIEDFWKKRGFKTEMLWLPDRNIYATFPGGHILALYDKKFKEWRHYPEGFYGSKSFDNDQMKRYIKMKAFM